MPRSDSDDILASAFDEIPHELAAPTIKEPVQTETAFDKTKPAELREQAGPAFFPQLGFAEPDFVTTSLRTSGVDSGRHPRSLSCEWRIDAVYVEAAKPRVPEFHVVWKITAARRQKFRGSGRTYWIRGRISR